VLVLATAIAVAGASGAHGRPMHVALPAKPTQVGWPALASVFPGDNAKRYCLGIKMPAWSIPYDGPCGWGSALGPMQTTMPLLNLNFQQLANRLNDRARNVSDLDRARLLNEIQHFQPLTPKQGRSRLHREAKKGKKSWLARAAVSCALIGSAAAGLTYLYDLVFHQVTTPFREDVGQNALFGCVGAVATPALNKLLKAKGFNLED
jgi:hypothetical protein